jgi:hypothetical protein
MKWKEVFTIQHLAERRFFMIVINERASEDSMQMQADWDDSHETCPGFHW